MAGFADSAGTATANQVLSKQRAQAVVAYLLQDCGIPVGRILAPGAMGETNPAASNESVSDARKIGESMLSCCSTKASPAERKTLSFRTAVRIFRAAV